MPIRQFKPVTKSSRFRSVSDFAEITRSTPEKSLLEPIKKSGGRDNHGHISMRRIGGGHKRKYRIIDFKRNRHGMPATVREIEYDPNRSARIALVQYEDGEKRYILHPKGLKVGDVISSGPGTDVRLGNALPLGEIPLGTDVHNVELKIGKGGQVCPVKFRQTGYDGGQSLDTEHIPVTGRPKGLRKLRQGRRKPGNLVRVQQRGKQPEQGAHLAQCAAHLAQSLGVARKGWRDVGA